MADHEIKAEIVFEDNEMMEVQSTVVEITREIEGRKNSALPLIPVVNEGGDEIWINANHIRLIKATTASLEKPAIHGTTKNQLSRARD
jgi:hypothetical protein